MRNLSVFDLAYPDEAKQRVIINTDAKNEADDQFAIVHALLTPSFELHGIIPAHYGTVKTPHSLQESYEETVKLLKLMDLEDEVLVEKGAPCALPDAVTPVASPGANLIIEEAIKADSRTLNVAFYGPLTDMASAILLAPEIQERHVRVIWIGGGPWPNGGPEFNLSNDINAANVVMQSKIELWQVPRSVYQTMGVTHAELIEKVYPHGKIGEYLVEQLLEFNAKRNPHMEYRSLGDSPCVGIILDPNCGQWSWCPAPIFDPQMHYIHTGKHRPIKVYRTVNTRFIHEDLFAKLAQRHRLSQVDRD